MGSINHPTVFFNEDVLTGEKVESITRRIEDLYGIFEDVEAEQKIPKGTLLYSVESYFPVKEGTEGGLFFGVTKIFPGTVGNEYFMTKGHFHSTSNRAEFYWGIKGEGMLIYMDRDRKTWAERMTSGSLHYIPTHVAHRVANIGNSELSFGACWPSDAGHDYGSIATHGFSARLKKIDGKPELVNV